MRLLSFQVLLFGARILRVAAVFAVAANLLSGCSSPEHGERVAASALSGTSYTVHLKTVVVGNYVSAEGGGGGDVNANRAVASTWETFTLWDLNGGALQDGDQVSLAASNGQFVTADDGGGGAVHANRAVASTWETFVIHRVGGGVISGGDQVQLQTLLKQLYLCALNGGGASVVADRAVASTWETFALEIVGGGGAPGGFWDASGIPPAHNAMMFKFLNRTNGKFNDSEVYWSFKNGNINETHSIAMQPIYDMPANSSGRMYFYLCAADDTSCAGDPTKSKYFDFIEHTIGPAQYNGNTTRVDAFGIKIAMQLHCADGFEQAVGEDSATFAEDRAATFQKFVNEVPAEFKALAQPPFAPYRIVEPGAGGFNAGGTYQHYYDSFVNELWAVNGLTIPRPGPNGDGLGAYPDISAAIFRHVGNRAGTFAPNGHLNDQSLWLDPSTFYRTAPYNAYAAFWHRHALDNKAYGFPYDDVGGNSTYISHANPQYMLVAIGW